MAKTALKKTAEDKPKKAKKAEGASKPRRKKAVKETAVAKACRITSCKREYRAKGYCKTHYTKWRQGEYGLARYKTCKDVGCFKPMGMNRHGYCEDHFQNYYVKGVEPAKVAAPAAAPAEEKAAG